MGSVPCSSSGQCPAGWAWQCPHSLPHQLTLPSLHSPSSPECTDALQSVEEPHGCWTVQAVAVSWTFGHCEVTGPEEVLPTLAFGGQLLRGPVQLPVLRGALGSKALCLSCTAHTGSVEELAQRFRLQGESRPRRAASLFFLPCKKRFEEEGRNRKRNRDLAVEHREAGQVCRGQRPAEAGLWAPSVPCCPTTSGAQLLTQMLENRTFSHHWDRSRASSSQAPAVYAVL